MMNPVVVRLSICWLAVSFCCLSCADEPWVKVPSRELLERTPGLIHETFDSTLMKTTVGYSLVLPPNYANSDKRFPVVYWLHGGGGNECSSLFTAQAWRELYDDQQIGEVILVYPNGFRSGYMDHHDGKVMVESMIIRELIPRIDERFRTVASRSGRSVHGFSMGASGSLKFAIKYPDLFCAAVAYGGGAIDTENTKRKFVLDILERNFKSDPKLIRQNNTYRMLEDNHESVRNSDVQFMLICGEEDSWKDTALRFQAALQEKNIACPLTLMPDVGHNLKGLTKAAGATAAAFQDGVFRKALRSSESNLTQ